MFHSMTADPNDPRDALLNEIAAFLRDSPRPIAETTFGRFSVNDGKFVARLRERKNITLDRMARCRQFMAEQRARWAGGDDRGRRAA